MKWHTAEAVVPAERTWSLGLGAAPGADGTRFRVWAPRARTVEVVIEGKNRIAVPLAGEEGGYFSGFAAGAAAGDRYRYRLDGKASYPDPCSRFQPQGPHGPSLVVDPGDYVWHDAGWQGLRIGGQVFYEIHLGTFTTEGTFEAAREELGRLTELGITVIELMPVVECAGQRNWGYDGVDLFAPYHVYGTPGDLKRFIDDAHAHGIGVVLDVVYNHLGPDGCYLQFFSDSYFSDRHLTDWGMAINFDGPGSEGVRELFVGNACYWIAEYHADGLRVDATQNIYDASEVHILSRISAAARESAPGRSILLVAENEPQDLACLAPVSEGGYGFDALWDDDFHHSLRVALTGFREAYFADYRGTSQELISLVKRCLLYQGQYYAWQDGKRGTPVTREPAPSFVVFLENHDQIANHLSGRRITGYVGQALYRAAAGFLLLAPQTPLLFMGQEFGAASPFVFFTDIDDASGQTYRGRKEFISQFRRYSPLPVIERLPDPRLASSFERCKLPAGERDGRLFAFHRDLLGLRKNDPVVARQDRSRVDGAVLSEQAFVLRYSGGADGDRLLAVNLGGPFTYAPLAEPLLVPPAGRYWKPVWSSDDPRYGGEGSFEFFDRAGFVLPGTAALLFTSEE